MKCSSLVSGFGTPTRSPTPCPNSRRFRHHLARRRAVRRSLLLHPGQARHRHRARQHARRRHRGRLSRLRRRSSTQAVSRVAEQVRSVAHLRARPVRAARHRDRRRCGEAARREGRLHLFLSTQRRAARAPAAQRSSRRCWSLPSRWFAWRAISPTTWSSRRWMRPAPIRSSWPRS